MRILLSCLQALKPHSLPAYDFWRTYFVHGLVEAGHEIVEVPNVDWAEGVTYPASSALDSWRARTWETVEKFVRREHSQKAINLFVGYFYPKQIEVSAIHELQRMGIPCVNFFCDNVREFVRVPTEYFPFALHWVPEFEALPMYRKARLPFIHAPMPCWIPPKLRSVPPSETEPATFLGSADVLRRDLLGQALLKGADFVVRGPGWLIEEGSANGPCPSRSSANVITNQFDFARKHGIGGLVTKLGARLWPIHPPPISRLKIGTPLFDEGYIRVTREAMVTIGVSRVPSANRSLYRPLLYSRLRDIEAPMLGACYLTEWTAGLEQLYEVGTEIETYRTAEDLTTKLNELRLDPARRMTMRTQAQRRALCDHTLSQSIKRIGVHLGF